MNPKDLAIRHQVYLERLKSGFVKDWEPVQRDLRKAIREVLTSLNVDTLQELNRKQLNKLLVELRQAHLSVSTAGMLEFSKQLEGVAGFSAALEATSLAGIVGTAYKFNTPTASLAYANAIAQPVQATGELLKPFIESWPELDIKRLNNTLRTGWAQDRPLMQMVREFTGSGGKTALDVSRRNAGAVIHTATQHTANAARMKVWEDNGDLVIGYHWVSTLDGNTTAQCRSMDEIYGVGKKFFKPGQGPLPPLHIRCRSTTVPKLGQEFDFLNEGATRASSGESGGYVPGDQGFYEWLKNQPADFQRSAIGPTRAKLLRDGGLTAEEFARLNLSKNFQPLTLAEMKQIEPEAFKRAGILQSK